MHSFEVQSNESACKKNWTSWDEASQMMKRDMIQKLFTKREINKQKLKVQPEDKLIRNIKEVKMSFLEKNA